MQSEKSFEPFRFLRKDEFTALGMDESLQYLQRAVEELNRRILHGEGVLPKDLVPKRDA
jgi:hypothetical protein